MVTPSIKNLARQIFSSYKHSIYYSYYKALKSQFKEIQDSMLKKLANKLDRHDPINLYSVGARFGLSSEIADLSFLPEFG
jgi:hypothetical protein